MCIDAEAAGVKTNDRLIEINGQNIQNLTHDQVTQRIRAINHPDPLQMLVTDIPTYDYYKQKQKLIDSRLPNVRVMPPNRRPSSVRSSHRRMSFLEIFAYYIFKLIKISYHFLAIDGGLPLSAAHEQPGIQATPSTDGFRGTSTSPVLEDLTNTNHVTPSFVPSVSSPTSLQPRHIPIKKDSQLSNGVGFEFRTINNDLEVSSTPYSHIVTSVDGINSTGSQGLRKNDYILSINDENVEYLNHEQLEDKLRRINNSETVRFLVADGNVYRAFKESSQNLRTNYDPVQEPKLSSTDTSLQQHRRQYRLVRSPDFHGYGFRVRSNYESDGTPHQIVSVEPYSPAERQGLRVGDYILRINNQSVEHMHPHDFNYLMQNSVNRDPSREKALLLEVMDENTYRSLNRLPPASKPHQSSINTVPSDLQTMIRSPYDSYPQSSTMDEPFPKIRQCFIRVRTFCLFSFSSIL